MATLQQLRYLTALADTLNFSRAADLTHVTQPTLSLQLKEMEARLGVQLVERTRARVILTPAGAEIARRARRILAEMDDIREIARSGDPGAFATTLQLGVVQTVGAYVLSLAMPELRRQQPKLRMQVREGSTATLTAGLADGSHDLLLLAEPPQGQGLVAAPLIREPLVLVLPADHRLAAQTAVDPADLRGETILSMDSGRSLARQIDTLCAAVGAVPVADYAGTTLDTLRQMVAAGMGLSLLPALYVRSDVLREKLVVARPLRAQSPVRPLTLCWRAGTPRAAAYEALARMIRDSLLPWDAGAELGP